jgi:tartronate-semialdehyde synthase
VTALFDPLRASTGARVSCLAVIASVLESEGIDTVFGVLGGMPAPLSSALTSGPDGCRLQLCTVHHAQAAVYAADGWARASGRVGVVVGAAGPAMLTGLHTALAESVPIVCLTGLAAPYALPPRAEQAADIVELARPVTKWAMALTEPAQTPWILREALRVARSGRPGPVLIDLGPGIPCGSCTYHPALDAALPVEMPEPPSESVRAAVALLLQAHRPLILAGGGVVAADACEELRDVAEHLQVPVLTTPMAKGAFPEDHPLFAGTDTTRAGWDNAVLLESDLVLAVGTQFVARPTGALDAYRRGRRFIHLAVEASQIGQVFEPDLGMVGHAKPSLAAIDAQARVYTTRRTAGTWVDRIAELRDSAPAGEHDGADTAELADVITPAQVRQELDRFCGRESTLVIAPGLHQIWSGRFRRTCPPRRYLVCGQPGPPGWEISAAIGARCANPDNPVVAVISAAPFGVLAAEVAAATAQRIPFMIVMTNSGGPNGDIDQVKLMDAVGCPARRVAQPGEIADALRWAGLQAQAEVRPVLVEITPYAGCGNPVKPPFSVGQA